jgi:hypothetical protein
VGRRGVSVILTPGSESEMLRLIAGGREGDSGGVCDPRSVWARRNMDARGLVKLARTNTVLHTTGNASSRGRAADLALRGAVSVLLTL